MKKILGDEVFTLSRTSDVPYRFHLHKVDKDKNLSWLDFKSEAHAKEIVEIVRQKRNDWGYGLNNSRFSGH